MRLIVSAFVFIMLAPGAVAQDVSGEWIGRYICAQGVTGLRLTIDKPTSGSMITATFAFGPVAENPQVPEGAYTMRGVYDPISRRVSLNGEKWIDAPFGYIMVGLDGYLSVNGDRIAGRIPDAFPCTDFEVRRPAQLIG